MIVRENSSECKDWAIFHMKNMILWNVKSTD